MIEFAAISSLLASIPMINGRKSSVNPASMNLAQIQCRLACSKQIWFWKYVHPCLPNTSFVEYSKFHTHPELAQSPLPSSFAKSRAFDRHVCDRKFPLMIVFGSREFYYFKFSTHFSSHSRKSLISCLFGQFCFSLLTNKWCFYCSAVL